MTEIIAKDVDSTIRPLTVDYSKSRAELLALGRYSKSQRDVWQRLTEEAFPIVAGCIGTVRFETRYVRSEKHMNEDRGRILIAALDQSNPWQPGGFEHALFYGIEFPDEMDKVPMSPILFLGAQGIYDSAPHNVVLLTYQESPWRKGNLMGLDMIKENIRCLAPTPCGSIWQPDTRMLAVRRMLQ